MKVLKPEWINHNGMPICTIDIHPDGSRVATGGQGEDSGRIVIWNMAPVVTEKMETDRKVPKMLCQLDNHLACVNCVRWSSSGKYLASGGDDKLVMIWTISKSLGGNSVFGGKGKVNLEGWRCAFTLRGHQGDVLDMAWSPNDHWLATCSVDNTVIVWQSDNLPEVAAVLKGHTGLVKGVSWDPVGKYLSSQSDDKTVRIWRTGDWHQEAIIKQPFEKCTGTTLVLRLSWSPDGQYLVTAHAMNGSVPTAQIIDRDGWTHDKDFVGHHMAVTCVRFSNFIMETDRKGKVARACACAIGSRDRSVSVWVTSLTRPVVVMEDLFSSPVNDLSWGPRGLSFMACSHDGTTAYLEFTEQEIGSPISDADKCVLFEKLYGKALIGNNDGGIVVVENPEVLLPPVSCSSQQNSVANSLGTPPKVRSAPVAPTTPGSGGASNAASVTVSTPSTPSRCPTNKQIETRRADGRRRITPIYIPPAPDTGEEVVPFGSDSSFSSSCVANKSNIIIEKREGVDDTTSLPPTTPKQALPPALITSPAGGGKVTAVIGAKSVQPSLVNCSAEPSTPAPVPAAAPPPTKHPTTTTRNNVGHSKPTQPSTPPANGGFTSLVTATEKTEGKRKRPLPSIHQRHGTSAARNNKRGPAAAGDQQPTRTSNLAQSHHPYHSPAFVLPPISLPPNKTIKVSGTRNVIQVDNNTSRGPFGNLTSIKCFSTATSILDTDGVKPTWEVMLGSEVCGCVASRSCIAVACLDGSLHLLNSHGEHRLPPLALGCTPALLHMGGSGGGFTPSSYVVCVTCDGRLNVWRVVGTGGDGGVSTIVADRSIAPLVAAPNPDGSELKIKDCLVSDEGEPMLALSSGKAFIFSLRHNTWLLVGNSGDPVMRNVLQCYKNSLRNPPTGGTTILPLKSLQAAAFNGVNIGSSRVMPGSDVGATCTLSYLDTQLTCARALHSTHEYKFWLMALVRFLLQQGMENRLRRICEELLGPRNSGSSSSSWEKEILGVGKHALLKDVLAEMSSNLKSQRLYMEFKEQLDEVPQPPEPMATTKNDK